VHFTDLISGENRPAAQVAHLEVPILPAYFPLGHTQQIEAPVISRNNPGVQLVHDFEASVTENQPAAHRLQGEDPVAENSPGLQLIRPANTTLEKKRKKKKIGHKSDQKQFNMA
jgi:hypothetical protein